MMSKSRMLRESKAGNYVHKALGRPFRDSRYLYRCLYRLHYATWQCNDPKIEAFYDLTNPVLTVLWHVQHLRTKAYALASRNRNIPAVAVLGSWDRPTSKGPIAPGMAKYLVNTAVMKSELKTHHAVPDADIVNVGWPQMDEFFTNRVGCDRQQFLRSQGFATDRALLVYAGNATRLGSHEPDIVEYLVDAVGHDQFARPCQLLIRAHPQDPQWHERFGRFEDSPNVYLQEPQMGNLDYLANLLRHADILLATQGSVTLDAIAMDTCVVNVAFDGNRNPCPEESIALFYEMDHYRPVVESGGVCIVRSFEELEGGINAYLNNPALHAEGRAKLRELELEPMDGMSSSRIVEVFRSHALA